MDPIDLMADRLTSEFPYKHERFGLRAIIKTILWVLIKTNSMKVQ